MNLDVPDGRTGVYIGEEIGIDTSAQLSLLMKRIHIGEYTGYLGIVGSTKMDYAFNITALRQVL
jgi:transcriptional regulator of heat shock response